MQKNRRNKKKHHVYGGYNMTRKQNDAKALAELDSKLRELDPNDPVKYDFALFGLGAFEGF